MGRIGKTIVYLEKADILEIHRKQMKIPEDQYRWNSGLIFENGLDYLVEIVKEDEIYQTIPQKAAVYSFNTITRHIFADGNKRTGVIFQNILTESMLFSHFLKLSMFYCW